jgi:hypothetical protein
MPAVVEAASFSVAASPRGPVLAVLQDGVVILNVRLDVDELGTGVRVAGCGASAVSARDQTIASESEVTVATLNDACVCKDGGGGEKTLSDSTT